MVYYVVLGDILNRLDSGYGTNTKKLLASALNEPGLKDNTLHKAARFAKAVQDGLLDVTELDESGVSWREAARLTSSKISAKQRRQILGQIKTGKITSARLGQALDHMLLAKTVATTRSIATARDRAVNAIRRLQHAQTNGQQQAGEYLEEIHHLLNIK